MPFLGTIKGRLVFLVALLVLLMAGLVVVSITNFGVRSVNEMRETSVRLQESALLVEWEEKAKALTALLAAQSVQPVSEVDYFVLNSSARLVLEGRDVRYVYILDNSARVLADGTKTLESVGTVLSDAITNRAMAANEALLQRQADFIDVSSPVELGSARLATVRIGFSTDRLRETINRQIAEVDETMTRISKETVRDTLLWALLVSFSVLAFGYIFVGRAVSSPLGELVRAARRIGSGDLSHRLDVGPTKNELSELGIALNEMVGRLRETTVSRDYIDNILTAAGEGIYGLDLEGRTTFANPAAARMIGWEAEDLIGKPQHDILHHTKPDGSPYPREECPIYAAFKDGTVHHVDDEVFWRKDGSSFPVEYVSTPIREDGKLTGAVVVFRDITERKQSEEILAMARERETELNNIRRQNVLGEMAAAVSHELNQPLTVISSYAQGVATMLRSGDASLDDLLEPIEILNDQANRAGKIIRSIRLLTDKQKAKKELVDLNAVIEETLTLVTPEYQELGIEITLGLQDGLPPVLADKIQIQQLLLNLVRNSLEAISEFACASSRLTVRSSRAKGDTVEVAIEDTGPGFPLNLSESLFKPFFTTKTQGQGLGLFICRSIIEAHEGRIWVDPASGKGATIRFSLQVADERKLQNA